MEKPRKQLANLNKVIVDYTSPALCTPVTTVLADLIYNERGSNGMTLVMHDVIGDRMIPLQCMHYNALPMGKKIPSQ